MQFGSETKAELILDDMMMTNAIYLLDKDDAAIVLKLLRERDVLFSARYDRNCEKYMIYFFNESQDEAYGQYKAILAPAPDVSCFDDIIDLSVRKHEKNYNGYRKVNRKDHSLYSLRNSDSDSVWCNF